MCPPIYPATVNQLWLNVYLKVSIYSLPFISSSRSLDHPKYQRPKEILQWSTETDGIMMGFSNLKGAMASILTTPKFVCARKANFISTPFLPAKNVVKQTTFSSAISKSATNTCSLLGGLRALYFLGGIRKRTLLLLSFTFALISVGNAFEIAQEPLKITPFLLDPMPIREFKGVVPGATCSSMVSEVTIRWLSALWFAFIFVGFVKYNGKRRLSRFLIFPTILAFAALSYTQNAQETLHIDTSRPPSIRAYKGIVPGRPSLEENSDEFIAWLFGLFLVLVLTALTDMDGFFSMPRVLPILALLSVGAMAYANNITIPAAESLPEGEQWMKYMTVYQILKWTLLLGIAVRVHFNPNFLVISLFWLATIPVVLAQEEGPWIGFDVAQWNK
jgi:hypothetical protein